MLSFFSRYGAFEQMAAMLPKKPVLLVLNYHRIGDPGLTEYDDGVFSATAEDLDAQVRFLKRRFHVVGLDETLELIARRAFRRAAVILTFDDGYRDNYDLAYPILSPDGLHRDAPGRAVGRHCLHRTACPAAQVSPARRALARVRYWSGRRGQCNRPGSGFL